MKHKAYMNYIIEMIEKLVNTPSPSGYTKDILEMMKGEAERLGYQAEVAPTGCLIVDVPGKEQDDTLCLAAHVDTLGAMVSAVTAEGTLKISPIGGYMMQTIEGEYCKIHSRRTGKTYTGTVLTKEPSVHVYDDAKTLDREAKNMEIRVDEKIFTKEDALKLGIGVGDYVSFAPRFVYTESGYIKSRHLDDKASAAVLFGFLKYLSDNKITTERHIKVILTGFEEIGHGASWLPEDVTQMLAVDMGCVGGDMTGDEYHVSICAKDSSGPYNYDMTNDLIKAADEAGVDYVVDVFPHYGSDVGAAIRGGNPIQGALIGQGVHASHGMERTHEEGLNNTLRLVMAYTGVKEV